MTNEIVKSQLLDTNQNKHFNLPVQERKYPSCYQYNVLIMLAKRLIKEEEMEDKTKSCPNRSFLERRLAKRIAKG